jgi:hypothetical protein
VNFTFEPETHTYRVDERKVPGVTKVISPLYEWDMVNQEMLRLAAERGSAVHLATELDDKTDLDENSIHPAVEPYLQAYRKFRAEKGGTPLLIEDRIYNPIHDYATTVDRLFRMQDRRLWLVEIKSTSQLHPAVGVQLAGQLDSVMRKHHYGVTPRRFALQLRKDGTYRLQEYTDPNDWPTFLALRAVLAFKEKHKQ